MVDNGLSYQNLGWVIQQSENGFFLLIASPKMQREVIGHYDTADIAVIDCKEREKGYSFTALSRWIEEAGEARAYILLNFHLLLLTPEDFKQFNFSRDMLARLKKNLVFCLTQYADDQLNQRAYDFYSYVRLTLPFADELPETAPKPEPAPVFDRSVGVNPEELAVDFSWTKGKLLSRAITLKNAADRDDTAGRYRDAVTRLEAAHQIRVRVLGEDHPDTAETFRALGQLYHRLGRYQEAEEAYTQALFIQENALGKENPSTAATYNGLAVLFENQGKYAEAEEYYRKALAIREKVLGADHPDTASTYNNLAVLYKNQGKYAEAEEYFRKALVICEKVLGSDHPDTAGTYNNLAVLYDNQGKYAEAEEYYRKALAIKVKTLGPDHPSTVLTRNNLARFQKSRQKASSPLDR